MSPARRRSRRTALWALAVLLWLPLGTGMTSSGITAMTVSAGNQLATATTFAWHPFLRAQPHRPRVPSTAARRSRPGRPDSPTWRARLGSPGPRRAGAGGRSGSSAGTARLGKPSVELLVRTREHRRSPQSTELSSSPGRRSARPARSGSRAGQAARGRQSKPGLRMPGTWTTKRTPTGHASPRSVPRSGRCGRNWTAAAATSKSSGAVTTL